jgi:hypothetical protein
VSSTGQAEIERLARRASEGIALMGNLAQQVVYGGKSDGPPP